MTPREAAVLSLNSSIKNDKFVNIELSASIEKYKFEGKDKSFYSALFYGTVERLITLDRVIGKLSSVKFDKLENMVLCILRVGLYQLMYMDKVPTFSLCDESTEMAKRFCRKSAVGFVNAVMREAVRKKENGELEKMLKTGDELTDLSLLTSIPKEMIELWQKDYGKSVAKKTAIAFSSKTPSYYIRVNTEKISRSLLCSKIGAIAKESDLCASAIEITGSVPVEKLYGFCDGLFFVQDLSSQLCASLFCKENIGGSPKILDLCSCPGGKSFSMAINFSDKAHILSCDLHEKRLNLVRSGAARLSLSSIETRQNDATVYNPEFSEGFDAVLCDVPCSGLGVIAKKPDIRYKPLFETEKLPTVQKKILANAAKYVKPGGMLVYSTCTLLKRENEDVVSDFLQSEPDFSLCATGIFPNSKDPGFITFFPDVYGTDGFFVARMKKNR